MPEKKTRIVNRIVKSIHVDVDKCNGCRACEVICSALHARPKYSSNNPARSRIRVIRQPLDDIYVPVYAGEYVKGECYGRNKYTMNGKVYNDCAFCRSPCPSRDDFKEPDSGLPLSCDMCESEPDLKEPLCVRWCLAEALIYEEREEAVAEKVEQDKLELGLEFLANEYGMDKLLDSVARMMQKDEKPELKR